MEVDPRADYFAFLAGEQLRRVLSQRLEVEKKPYEYTRLGRARITVEWLEDDEAAEEASAT